MADRNGIMDMEETRRSRISEPLLWVGLYFLANLSLTLHNKWVLSSMHFRFPWTLTLLHISVTGLGSWLMMGNSPSKSRLDMNGQLRLLCFSLLYTVNIAVSNVSMSMVALPFHQLVRSATPVFTVLLEVLLLRRFRTTPLYLTLLPVVAGIMLATMAEFHGSHNEPHQQLQGGINITMLGCGLTVFGVLLAALKGILTNSLLSGPLAMHPLEAIYRLAPYAALQCAISAWYFGELDGAHAFFAQSKDMSPMFKLMLNGLLAMFLNWVSFTANKKTSALTITVAGNIKQALSILLAMLFFGGVATGLSVLGIILTLGGGLLYSLQSYRDQLKRTYQLVQSSNTV